MRREEAEKRAQDEAKFRQLADEERKKRDAKEADLLAKENAEKKALQDKLDAERQAKEDLEKRLAALEARQKENEELLDIQR